MTIDPTVLFGRPVPRIDGVAKVTGAARYASDEPVAHPAYAYLVTSSFARGKVTGFKLDGAQAVPGVLDILTHENVGTQVKALPGPDGGPTPTSLDSDRVWHAGQIIAVVVAETFEAAREAAHKVEVSGSRETPSGSFGSAGLDIQPLRRAGAPDAARGDAEAGFAAAPVRIERRYATPTQHHNPIELYTTTCVWDGPRLTVYQPSQFMYGLKASLAKQLGLDAENVRTVSRFVGGAFGGKAMPLAHTAWVAIAARRLGRPVMLAATRDQGFTIATYRAESQHHVKLGATRDGRLVSFSHEGWEVTSRPSSFALAGTRTTARMYACPNIATAVNLMHADRNTPGFMRAPSETPYMFALESAMDELACELGMDPVELRRINDTQRDPVSGLEFSSRSLMQCYDQAAARFGWSDRKPEPGAMRDGDWLVGYGCASACYPATISPAAARVSLAPTGKATVELAAHELGTGAYTVVAITAARSLGLDVGDVTVRMGDSDLPPVTAASGSANAASTTVVVVKACEEIRRRIAEAAAQAADGPLHGADPSTLTLTDGKLMGPDGRSEALGAAVGRTGGRVEAYAENVPEGAPANAMANLYQGQIANIGGTRRKDVVTFSFGAHFVEVRVHSRTKEVRMARAVSAFAAGTIINPITAQSQLMGGVIWGLSSALHEATEIDPRTARYTNANLAEYMVPVNADVPSVEIIMVPEKDERVNLLGVKGVGEIGVVGMSAAVANALFNATGTRVRELPVRLEQLL